MSFSVGYARAKIDKPSPSDEMLGRKIHDTTPVDIPTTVHIKNRKKKQWLPSGEDGNAKDSQFPPQFPPRSWVGGQDSARDSKAPPERDDDDDEPRV